MPATDGPARVAVVGIGHELRGDDAVGGAAARALRQRTARWKHVLVVDAGAAPENHTATLRRFAPRLIVLVDAAQMDLPPGAVRAVEVADTTGLSASTHTIPVAMLARFLSAELGAEIVLVGIQPDGTEIGAGLSLPARRAVEQVATVLAAVLRP